MIGFIEHKGRRCGAIYISCTSTPDISKTLALALNGEEINNQSTLDKFKGTKLLEIHVCGPGILGIADLWGGKLHGTK